MKKKIFLGIAVAGICLWLSLRHVNLNECKEAFKRVHWMPFLALPIMVALTHYFRARRWKIFLAPIRNVNVKELFALNAVGFMSINLFPLRLGEFTRPLLLKKRQNIPFATAFATIAIERIFDGLCAAICLSVGILGLWDETDQSIVAVRTTGISALIATSTVLAFVLLSVVRRKNAIQIVEWFVKILPVSLQTRITEMAHHFFDGLKALPNLKSFASIIMYSFVTWGIMVSANYFTFKAFQLDLPASAMFMALGMATLGMSIPGAPASVGTLQLAIQMALGFYGVSQSVGFAYAVVTHVINFSLTILLGLIYLPYVATNVSSLYAETKNVEESNEPHI